MAGNYTEDYLDESVCKLMWVNMADFMPLGAFPAWGNNKSLIAEKLTNFLLRCGYRDTKFQVSGGRIWYRVPNQAALALVALMNGEYEE